MEFKNMQKLSLESIVSTESIEQKEKLSPNATYDMPTIPLLDDTIDTKLEENKTQNYLILINTNRIKPGSRTYKALQKFKDKNCEQFDIAYSASIEETEKILKNTECKNVVVCGGDGTVNTTANIIMQNNLNHLALGVIPAGTKDFFAKYIGMKRRLKANLKTIKKATTDDNYYTLADIGHISNVDDYIFATRFNHTEYDIDPIDHYFLSAAGFGLSGRVINNLKGIKHKNKQYVLTIIKNALEIKNKKEREVSLKIHTSEEFPNYIRPHRHQFLTVEFLNAFNYLGKATGLNHSPNDDGLGDLFLVKNPSIYGLVQTIGEVIYNKYKSKLEKILHPNEFNQYRNTSSENQCHEFLNGITHAWFEMNKSYYVHADGETIGKTPSGDVKWIKQGITIIAPPKSNFIQSMYNMYKQLVENVQKTPKKYN